MTTRENHRRHARVMPKHVRLLMQWQEMHEEENDLLQAGAERNAVREASCWGPILVAALVEGGHLQPGQSPLEALNALCDYNPETDA